jgi:hypothetical protein
MATKLPPKRKPKLSASQVKDMRRQYGRPPGKSGRRPAGVVTMKMLAEKFAVSADTVRNAILGKGAYQAFA